MRERPLTEFLKTDETEEVKKESKQNRSKSLDGPWELPEGWKWVRLRDIIKNIFGGGTPPTSKKEYWGGDIPWVSPKDMKEFYINDSQKHVTHLAIKENLTKLVPENSILVVFRSSILLKKLPVAINKVPTAINQDLKAIIPISSVHPSFLALYLLSKGEYVLEHCRKKGVTVQSLEYKKFINLPIPLPFKDSRPDLEEQKRIVAKLDEIYAKLEEAKRLAREAKEQAEKLMASALHEVFSKADERGWEWVKLKNLVRIRGNSGVKKKLSQFDEVAYISMEMIPEKEIFAKYEIKKSSEIKSYSYCEVGDILLAKITPCFENGKQGIVPDDVPNGFALATTEVYSIFVIDQTKLHKMYLFHILRSHYVRKTLEEQMLGTTGRQRVPKEAILHLKIPLPPFEEQKRIVAYLDAISERARQLIKLYEEREKELEKLWFSALDKAFKGKI